MKLLCQISILLLFTSCHDKHLEFVEQVENIGIDKFINLEYGKRGEKEHYSYYFVDTATTGWSYNLASNQFEVSDQQKLAAISDNPIEYITSIRADIKSLNVVMISQSPWPGNFVRFWLSDSEFISYANPNFKFDDDSKRIWLNELQSGKLIRENWYYINTRD